MAFYRDPSAEMAKGCARDKSLPEVQQEVYSHELPRKLPVVLVKHVRYALPLRKYLLP